MEAESTLWVLMLAIGAFALIDILAAGFAKYMHKKIDQQAKQAKLDLEQAHNLLELNSKLLQEMQRQRDNEKLARRKYIIDHRAAFLEMSYDEFVNWLEANESHYLPEAVEHFKAAALPEHAKITQAQIDKNA